MLFLFSNTSVSIDSSGGGVNNFEINVPLLLILCTKYCRVEVNSGIKFDRNGNCVDLFET